jgi:PAS domain S-box-containing protein
MLTMTNSTFSISSQEATSASVVPGTTEQADYNQLLRELEELKKAKTELEAKQFIDTTLANFAELMRWRVDQTLQTWADEILVALIQVIRGLQASLYLYDENTGHFLLIGKYACPPETPEKIVPGFGLAGQAVKTGQPIVLNEGSGFRALNPTSLSMIEAQSLLILPLTYNDEVEGLLEITSLRPYTDTDLHLLKVLGEGLGSSLNTIRSQSKIQRLYHEAQEKSEALVAQEEELRQNLEELQATQDQMRLAQKEISEARMFLDATINSTSFMMFATDEHGNVRIWNQAISQATGYAANEVLNHRASTLVLKEEDELTQASLQFINQQLGTTYTSHFEAVVNYLTHNPKLEREFNVVSKNNSIFPAWVALSAWRTPEKRFAGLVVVAQDLTDRKKAEQLIAQKTRELEAKKIELENSLVKLEATHQLAESQKNLIASMINSTDDVIFAIDPKHRLLLFNKQLERIFQQGGKQLAVGTDVYTYIPETIKDYFRTAFNEALTGKVLSLEGEFLRVPYDTRYFPLLDAEGKIIGCAMIARPIAERKQMEQDKLRQQNRLKEQEKGLAELYQLSAQGVVDEPAIRKILKNIAQSLDIGQVGLWLMPEDSSSITAKAIYIQATDEYIQDVVLQAADYPAYFSAVRNEGIIRANDVYQHPATLEFDAYFKQYGIGAMLDVPIRQKGQIIGVICCEHVGGAREWYDDEVRFAHTAADIITLALEIEVRVAELQELSEAHNRLQQHLQALVTQSPVAAGIIIDGQLHKANAQLETLRTGETNSGFDKKLAKLLNANRELMQQGGCLSWKYSPTQHWELLITPLNTTGNTTVFIQFLGR